MENIEMVKDHAVTSFLNLVSLFEKQAERTPTNVAVIENTDSLTYQELNEAASHLAVKLDESTNWIVAVLLPQGIHFLASSIAVLKTGKTISPLSTESTTMQLLSMLEELGNPFLISTDEILNQCRLKEYSNTVRLPLPKSPCFVPSKSASTPNPAYCIFTSGTTGEPKGVLVDHAAYLNVTEYRIKTMNIKESDRSLLFGSPAFDLSIAEIWSVLATGGTLLVPPPHYRYAVNLLKNWVYDQKISLCFLTTYIGVKFLKICSMSEQNSNIRSVSLGGEKLHRYPTGNFNFQIYNFYGPTETAIYATGSVLEPGQSGVPNIGKPIDNVSVYIMDKNLEEVSIGSQGEICIAGVGVGRGYLNKPELTKHKFVTLLSGIRIYKSGDEGYIDSEGNIHCIDRIDHQVKIRGLRIELGNIEHVLMDFPAIETAVVDVETVNGEMQLFAYCKTRNGNKCQEIFSYIQTRLSHYEQPAAIYAIESFPLTSSGKVDRKQLNLLKTEACRIKPDFLPPITDIEIFLAKTWASVLNISTDQIGRNASFFAYGGNSIGVVLVLERIEMKIGITLSLHTFFRGPTIMQLAEALDIEQAKPQENVALSKSNDPDRQIPLTRSQELMFRKCLENPHTNEHNFSWKTSFNQQNVTPEIISEAIKYIVNQHSIFHHTIHVSAHGNLFQEKSIPESALVPVILHLECEKTGLEPWDEASRLFSEASDIRFDLAVGPLAKFYIICVSKNCIKFQIVTNYLIMDLTALNDFIYELNQLVQASLGDHTHKLTKPRNKFSDFAVWQREQAFDVETAFWRQYLKDVKCLVLPCDNNPRQPNNAHPYHGFVFRFQISMELVRKVDIIARTENTTHFIVLLTAFKLLFHKYSGESDILVCSMTTGRHAGEFGGIIGNFENPILIRTKFPDGNMNFRRALQVVHNSAISVYENSQMPCESVKENCIIDQTETGLTRVCIQHLARSLTQVVSGLNSFQVHSGNQSNHDLMISFEGIAGNSIDVFIEANSYLFSKEYILRLKRDLQNILAHL